MALSLTTTELLLLFQQSSIFLSKVDVPFSLTLVVKEEADKEGKSLAPVAADLAG
jgi:hypothetical protein